MIYLYNPLETILKYKEKLFKNSKPFKSQCHVYYYKIFFSLVDIWFPLRTVLGT